MLPSVESEHENRLLCVTSVASENPFMCLVTNRIPNYHLAGAGCGTQVLPFYIYDEDGSNRRENITDWALNEFRTHHSDPNLTKWDIFHYVYAVLHHPEYRERYAANLKVSGVRELIQAAGAELLYLPPYSPDLNPIEQAWAKLKQFLRSLKARTAEALEQAVTQALPCITPDNARSWFRHCGINYTP